MLFGSRKGINNASLRCFTDRVKASIAHRYDALQMEEVSIFANSFGPMIKFTCEMSSERAVILDTEVFNRPRLSTLRILDSQTHFIKGEALRLLTTNSVKDNFYKHKRDFEFEQRLSNRSYPTSLVHKILTEVQFSDRTEVLPNKTKKAK